MNDSAAPAHWIPDRLLLEPGEARCRWIDIGDVRFSDPFFDMTLSRRWHEGAGESISPLPDIYHRAAAATAVAPGAFLFHVSRCGSTLFSQLLGLDERSIVLSEPPILEEVLRSDLPDREGLYVATLSLLCRARFGIEEKAFVKTDSWHLFDAATLRRLYPRTPFVLLYRSPNAVLASHRRARGMQMVPGLVTGAMAPLEYDPERMTLDHYAAAVLERFYRAMLSIAQTDSNSLLVSYDEGFPAAFLRTAEWLELDFDDEGLERVQERCGYHAKTPQEPFRGEEVPELAGVDLAVLSALHERLEERRCLQVGRRARRAQEGTDRDAIARRIVDFLVEIGVSVEEQEIPETTFLPGISIQEGVLRFDPSRLEYPGDLLHEAGHLAVLPPSERRLVSGQVGSDGGNEMAAIAWSFAASQYLGLPLDVLFHPDGYKGDSACLAENFSSGRYIGVPILEWRGMTSASGATAYPTMIHWLCP